VKFYSFNNQIVILAALPLYPPQQLSGWASGDDAITMSYNAERAMPKVGAEGRVAMALTADNSAKFVLKFMQTSGSNKVLNNLANLQKNPLTAIPIVLTIQDTYRQDRAVGTSGVITKVPDVHKGAGINEYSWELFFERFDLSMEDPAFIGLATSVVEGSL
jgi:hypothetical protein